MRDYLITILLLGPMPFALFSPHIGVLGWSVVSYMNIHRFAWGFATTIPFAAIAATATLIGLVLSSEKKKFPLTTLTKVWILFIFWISFTTLFAFYSDLAFTKWILVMKIMLISFVTVAVMARRDRLELLIWVIVLSIGFYGIKGGVFTILRPTGGTVLVFGPPKSFLQENNSLALALVMVLPLMNYLRKINPRRLIRLGILAGMGLIVAGIIGTHSRGGALALAAVVMTALFSSRYKIQTLVALIPIVIAGLAFAPEAWKARIETIQHYEQDSSAMTRINAWHTSYNLASDRFLGGGFDAMQKETYIRYAPDASRVFNAHSIYFEVLAEHGFVGLAIFITLGILVLRSAKWVIVRTRERNDLLWAHDLSAMLRLSIIGYLVGGAFLNLAYFDLYYHLVAIIVVIRMLVEKQFADESVPLSVTENVETETTVKSPV